MQKKAQKATMKKKTCYNKISPNDLFIRNTLSELKDLF